MKWVILQRNGLVIALFLYKNPSIEKKIKEYRFDALFFVSVFGGKQLLHLVEIRKFEFEKRFLLKSLQFQYKKLII